VDWVLSDAADTSASHARAALSSLEELLTEFHFVAETDKAAALAAIFTAVVRPNMRRRCRCQRFLCDWVHRYGNALTFDDGWGWLSTLH
jgi:hypothetical protein